MQKSGKIRSINNPMISSNIYLDLLIMSDKHKITNIKFVSVKANVSQLQIKLPAFGS